MKETIFSDKIDEIILLGDEADKFLRLLHKVDQNVWDEIKQDRNNHKEIQAQILNEMSDAMRSRIRVAVMVKNYDGIKLRDFTNDNGIIEQEKLSPAEKEFATRCFIAASEQKQPSAMAAQLKEFMVKQSNSKGACSTGREITGKS